MTQRQIPIQGAAHEGCASCASSASCASLDDPDRALRDAGWVQRTTIGEPRLSELADNYRAMGYDVHVAYFSTPDGDAGCTSCFDAADPADARQTWGTVYVRRRPGAAQPDEPF